MPRLDRLRQRRPLVARAVEDLFERRRPPRQLDLRSAADEDDELEARKVQSDQPVDELVMRDEHLRIGEVQRVLEVRPTRCETERGVHGAGGVRAEPGAKDVRTGGHPDGHVVPEADARLDERVGRRRGRARREQIGDRALLARRKLRGSLWCRHRVCHPELRSLKLGRTGSIFALVPDVAQMEVPVPYLGSVNVWLLLGDPLTLIDAGPSNEDAFAALEQQLADHGVAVEDLELVLITHHHLDHSGLAARIKERSGAEIAAHRGTAQWGRSYHERAAQEHRFTLELIQAHGVPEYVVAGSWSFFDYIVRESTNFETDRVLRDGDTIRAGDRTLRAVFRPGHSTTDTLFVDESSRDAFVGDHLLATITSGAELVPTELPGDERRRALLDYLSNLRKTGAMDLATCYSGHGPTIDDHL